MINLQIIYAAIMVVFIGGVAGYIGSLMVTKRMSLMGGSLGHLAMPGAALAMLYDIDVSLGALIFLFFGVLSIWLLEQKTKLPIEALTAVVFAFSVSVTFLLLPGEKTIQALMGDVSSLSFQVTMITVIVSLLIFFTVKKIFSGLVLMSISQDVANSLHINVKMYNLVYLICIALVVALGVRIVGGLMTAALVAIPACTSKNISANLYHYSYGSMFFGSLASALGVLVFGLTGIAIGPLIIIFSSLLFLISVFFKK